MDHVCRPSVPGERALKVLTLSIMVMDAGEGGGKCTWVQCFVLLQVLSIIDHSRSLWRSIRGKSYSQYILHTREWDRDALQLNSSCYLPLHLLIPLDPIIIDNINRRTLADPSLLRNTPASQAHNSTLPVMQPSCHVSERPSVCAVPEPNWLIERVNRQSCGMDAEPRRWSWASLPHVLSPASVSFIHTKGTKSMCTRPAKTESVG